MILEYSGIYDGYRAVTGKDPETSQNISSTDQALSAASIIPFMKIIKGGKYVFKIDQGEKLVKRVEKRTSVTGQVGWSLSKGGGIINKRKFSACSRKNGTKYS
ncbi:pre-toxin TG domain-containing protein [Bacillus pumilus]|uniref:pre-toxin TG domain-containing protein n=1 Tax=Bacillus pumilus TaxID=1408 RepID=UPI0028CBB352|nr:pre-toxin TG domain-containing protein [Bacillus pumilus]